jgi:hypothetical protein
MRKHHIAGTAALAGMAIFSASAFAQTPVFNCVGSASAVIDFSGPGGNCTAPTGTTTSGKRSDNALFLGFQWNFAQNAGWEIALGFRGAKTDYSGDTNGFTAQIVFPLKSGVSVDRVKVGAFTGKVDYMAGIGLGYSFADRSPLIGGELTIPYAVAGLDYIFNNRKINPYVGVNTLARLKKPVGGGIICPTGRTPVALGAQQPNDLTTRSLVFLGGLGTFTGFDATNAVSTYVNGSTTCFIDTGAGGGPA